MILRDLTEFSMNLHREVVQNRCSDSRCVPRSGAECMVAANCVMGVAVGLVLLSAMAGCADSHPAKEIKVAPEVASPPRPPEQVRLTEAHYAASHLCDRGTSERLRDASDQGQVPAQAELGVAYFYGHCGLPIDSDQAAHWLGKAAEAGDMYAQEKLAFMYEAGQPIRLPYRTIKETGWFFAPGIPQDYEKALALYRRCADQGNIRCQSTLSAFYSLGCRFRPIPATYSDSIPASNSDRIPATHSDLMSARDSDRIPATSLS